jgi:predicted membrane protein
MIDTELMETTLVAFESLIFFVGIFTVLACISFFFLGIVLTVLGLLLRPKWKNFRKVSQNLNQLNAKKKSDL